MDLVKIGECLRDLRREKGLTQEQLAEKLNVSRRTVSRWETGSSTPDLDVLLQLTDLYGVDLRSLLNGETVRKEMTDETKETVQQIAILDQEIIKHEKERKIRTWAAVYLVVTVLNSVFSLLLSHFLPFGLLSGHYAFATYAFSDNESIWFGITFMYFYFIYAFSVFAFTVTLVKGKGLWFLILCCVDSLACLIIFLCVPDIEPGPEHWSGLAIQIVFVALFVLFNYLRKNTKRLQDWAQNLLIWCCPAIVLIAVFLSKPNSYTVLGNVVVCGLSILFGLIVTRLIFLFRSHRTVGGKIWRCVIWSIVLIVLLLFSLFFFSLGTSHRSTKINAKQRFEAEVERVLPDAISTPLELDSPRSVVLHKFMINYAPFVTRADILICQYDDAAYETAKTTLENRYSFRTELLENDYADDPEKKLLEPYAEIGDDHFRILYPNDGDDQAWGFYKRSIWVVTNDNKREIGYILFNDFDLDYVDDLPEFFNDYCGWKYVRN